MLLASHLNLLLLVISDLVLQRLLRRSGGEENLIDLAEEVLLVDLREHIGELI